MRMMIAPVENIMRMKTAEAMMKTESSVEGIYSEDENCRSHDEDEKLCRSSVDETL